MNELTARLMPHLMLAPIVLPMLSAALMLLLREERQRVKFALGLVSTVLGLGVAVLLMLWTDQAGAPVNLGVYMPGNWPMPFGISLALDRLTGMMLVLTYTVALASLIFSSARWHRAGMHFHSLFQFQLMGLSGAFLTADLFNLFVFFEIMLAASYGLLLHGSGRARIQAGLHYIAINLAASSLFLIGVSMLYGLTGTLNMADLARAIPQISSADRGLLHSAAAILGIAFLTKAAMWPLNFWLVPAYSAATAPVGAVFALMTKVGVYVVLRLWTLLFSSEAGSSALFGSTWLIVGGMLTMAFGGLGMLGSQRLTHIAGFAAILSSGTLLAATGFGQNALTAGLLYYLPSSTLAVSALFLIADVVDRWRVDDDAGEPYEDDDGALPQRRAASHRRVQPRRIRRGADRPRHSRRSRLHRPELHAGHPGGYRPAPAVGLRGQVRHAVCPAQPAGPGQLQWLPGRLGRLGAGGADDHHRAAGPAVAGARRHTPLLGDRRAELPLAARGRRPAHRLAAGLLRGTDDARRRADGLHPARSRCAAGTRCLCALRHGHAARAQPGRKEGPPGSRP